MKRTIVTVWVTAVFVVLSACSGSIAESQPVVEAIELIPKGNRIRIQSTAGTKTYTVKEEAIVDLAADRMKLTIDGQTTEEFVLPPKPPALGAGQKVEGSISNLKFIIR